MKFLIDNCLSQRLAEHLTLVREPTEIDEYIHLTRKFPGDTTDTDVIKTLEREGNWAIITCDCGGGAADKHAWQTTTLTVFLLSHEYANARLDDQVLRLIRSRRQILKKARDFPTRAKFIVGWRGNIRKF